ncbi:MAG: hypothetical protein HWD85_04215 [Flavobacteriaceae bacterium]|nr:hypothetical protein [Flavobacteriaceae bacterium]
MIKIKRYSLVFRLLLFKSSLLFITSCSKVVINKENFIQELKKEYNLFEPNNVIDINYTRVNYNAYQSYNYKNPDSLFIKSHVIINVNDSVYFASRIAKFPGVHKFSQQEFQKNNIGFIYDSLGVVLGKRVLRQNKASYNQVKNEVYSILNFYYIQDLVTDKSVEVLGFKSTYNGFSVSIKNKINDTLIYSFIENPIELVSVENETSKELWNFLDFNKNYASKIQYFKNGQLKYDYKINSLYTKDKIADSYLSLPQGYEDTNIIENKELELTKIGENIYLITNVANDRNIVYQLNRNKITVFGAPISDKFSEEVFNLIKKKHLNAEINKVYITHPHSDHIGGLKFYANKGVKIITDKYSADAIKNYPKFIEHAHSFQFDYIKDESVIDDVKYYFPKNNHSKSQSFAYFINENLIYQGDFIQIPADNSIPKHVSETTISFVDFVRSKNLQIDRIICHHRNNNLDLDILNTIK